MSTPLELWKRYQDHLCTVPSLGLSLDISRMNFADDFWGTMEPRMQKAFAAMAELEKGAIANPDEQRMVGHYWLRAPDLAPHAELGEAIRTALNQIKVFASNVHHGEITASNGKPFTDLLVVGIGGSALGPQFVAAALGRTDRDHLRVWFFDNTDPDGMDEVLRALGPRLATTLMLVISKSGGTKETRNGQLEARHACEKAGLPFARHAVAVTGAGSELSKTAAREGWLAEFPMWDWVGGRTSVLSAVGLLPAALQGLELDDLLGGARAMDAVTRATTTRDNPAALLALMWFHATEGRGAKDMVILPYKDRLLLLSRYLQQLIMESLGKERDLAGQVVHQGITVYGNKGSTDQHAYVQQLRDGVANFFATFIEVLRDREGASFEVDPGVTSGDYLHGFLHGTRAALYEKGRQSLTITIPDVSARSVGALIALYERAVGLYAALVGINAYHQPGVEAGKKAAGAILDLQHKLLKELERHRGQARTAEQLAAALHLPDEVENIHHLLRHLAADPARALRCRQDAGSGFLFVKE